MPVELISVGGFKMDLELLKAEIVRIIPHARVLKYRWRAAESARRLVQKAIKHLKKDPRALSKAIDCLDRALQPPQLQHPQDEAAMTRQLMPIFEMIGRARDYLRSAIPNNVVAEALTILESANLAHAFEIAITLSKKEGKRLKRSDAGADAAFRLIARYQGWQTMECSFPEKSLAQVLIDHHFEKGKEKSLTESLRKFRERRFKDPSRGEREVIENPHRHGNAFRFLDDSGEYDGLSFFGRRRELRQVDSG